jgi:D-sedoheptulose 7-phosphate isomerase
MWKDELEAHIKVFETLSEHEFAAATYVELVVKALNHTKKLFFAGNGGSAADAQHISTEFVVRYKGNRRALPAIALTTDTSVLTAIANDLGYTELFSRQIEALGSPGDILTLLSTSGNSDNLIRCATIAKAKGLTVIGLLGNDGGRLKHVVDLPIIVKCEVTARIQEAHIFILHHLIENVEKELFGDD